jgi:hypothetical protein
MKKDDDGEQKVVFCTECGDKLDNFCFNESVTDVDAVKQHMEGCKREGRFKGDMCSRVFIADDKNISDLTSAVPDDEDDV